MRQDDVDRLPPAAAERFTHKRSMTWDDLTTPRDLVKDLARENGVEVAGLELVPHDLWAAAELPPLSWIDRLTLIAAEFDLTFTVEDDGAAVRLVPLPDRVAIVRSYPGGSNAAAKARAYAALAPGAEVKVSAGRIYVRGLVEDQERLTQPRHPAAPPKPPAGKDSASQRHPTSLDRYTLTVKQQPVGRVLEQLARELNLELVLDGPAIQRAGLSLDERVSFSVRQATTGELLEAAGKPAGLQARRRGHALEVGPAKP
jgi:hypothetical protein